MSETLFDADFVKQLPQPLTYDTKMTALAQAAAEELLKVSGLTQKVLIYTNIEQLPEELLDILAYDLHCDWYDCKYPLDVKRKILKNNIKIHRKLGTKYAVERALADVYSTAEVKEWFEYNGNPYCFKVTVNVSKTGIDESTAGEIEAKMKFYKNARSHCDGIYYRMDADPASVTAIANLLYGGNIKVKPLLKDSINAAAARARILRAAKMGETLKIKPLLKVQINADAAAGQIIAGTSEKLTIKVKAKLEDALKGGGATETALMYQKAKNTILVKKKEE